MKLLRALSVLWDDVNTRGEHHASPFAVGYSRVDRRGWCGLLARPRPLKQSLTKSPPNDRRAFRTWAAPRRTQRHRAARALQGARNFCPLTGVSVAVNVKRRRRMPKGSSFIRIVESVVRLNPRLSAILAFGLGVRAGVAAKRLAGGSAKSIEHQAMKLVEAMPSIKSLPTLSGKGKSAKPAKRRTRARRAARPARRRTARKAA